MKTVVAIPWRPNGDLYRSRNHNYVVNYFSKLGYEVYDCDPGDGGSFNRAAVRNLAAGWAYDGGADVVVVCDADCVPPISGLTEAIDAARTSGGLHYPFADCLYLAHAETDSYLYDPATFTSYRPGGYASGGCFIIHPDDWFAAGGMDERLATWGGEDDAFFVAQQTLVAHPQHHTGTMYHLYHTRDDVAFGTPEHQSNIQLLARYSGASGNPSLMRTIIGEWQDAGTWPTAERSRQAGKGVVQPASSGGIEASA